MLSMWVWDPEPETPAKRQGKPLSQRIDELFTARFGRPGVHGLGANKFGAMAFSPRAIRRLPTIRKEVEYGWSAR